LRSRPFQPDRSNPGLNPEACRSILVNRKSRVTFYYLLADATGTLGELG
jgi:hypothetical protein